MNNASFTDIMGSTLNIMPSKDRLIARANITIDVDDTWNDVFNKVNPHIKDIEERYRGTIILPKSGCYEWFGLTDGLSYYVGKAKNVRARLQAHLDAYYHKDKNNPVTKAMELTDEDMGVRIWYGKNTRMMEGYLIKKMKPKYNSKPSGLPCIYCDTGMLMAIFGGEIIGCTDCDRMWTLTDDSIEQKINKELRLLAGREKIHKIKEDILKFEERYKTMESRKGKPCSCGVKHRASHLIFRCMDRERGKEWWED